MKAINNTFDYFLDDLSYPDSCGIRIVNVGFSHNAPNYSCGYVNRKYFLFHYVVSGKGTYHINNRSYFLKKGDGFIVPPHTDVIYRSDKDTPWAVYWFGFSGPAAIGLLKHIHISASNILFRYDRDDNLSDAMGELLQTIQGKEFNAEHLISRIYRIFGLLNNQTPFMYSEETGLSCVRYIKTHLSSPVGVSDLAIEENLSRSEIYRIFMKRFNMSPQAFIIQYKMKKARELILNTDLPYKEIGLLVGYEYVSHFYRLFKANTGMTPSEYRSIARSDRATLHSTIHDHQLPDLPALPR